MNRLKNLLLTFIALATLACGALTTEVFAAPQPISACQTISASGSYILTGNLTATGDCLLVAADNITIDLDGYTITGPGSGFAGITPPNTAIRNNITIRNGMIKNFGIGIQFALGKNGRRVTVERMTITDNTSSGVLLGDWSIVKDSNISLNGGTGSYVGARSLISGNIVSNNKGDGIHLSAGDSIVNGNVANNNSNHGIVASDRGSGSSLIYNTASNNGQHGISIMCPSNLQGNTAINNGLLPNIYYSGTGCVNGHNLAP
jgi:parallel beta-helix repeat protein